MTEREAVRRDLVGSRHPRRRLAMLVAVVLMILAGLLVACDKGLGRACKAPGTDQP